WARFKAAQDTFFDARNAVFAERDAELRVNAEAKEKILADARAEIPVSPTRAGPVPGYVSTRRPGRLPEGCRAMSVTSWRAPSARSRTVCAAPKRPSGSGPIRKLAPAPRTPWSSC